MEAGTTSTTLSEVILNGNKVLKRTVGETKPEYEPTTAKEKQDRRNEMKARGTLLMALPNKDQLKFHSYKMQKTTACQVIDKFKSGLGYNAASSTAASPAAESFVNLSEMLKNQENNKSKSDKGYHAVPSPYYWDVNFPSNLDQTIWMK
ncbi:hypothetical protein Tco_0769050 [Tanacetum coccineum]|uniref:Uncharacterized protein n=1 Tax=Tanacetum coccineum TaxID=301880 RepID=A0ABQ4Z8C9_9ASTR